MAAAVSGGELDLGIVTLPIRAAEAEGLAQTPLVEDELRLIVPPRHALAGQKSFRWKDLEGERVVGFEAGSAVREVLDRAAAGAGVALDVVMELRSIESIKGMVAAGVGVGFVSRFALRGGEGLACRDGRLVRRMVIVRRRDRTPGPAAAAFERELKRAAG